MLVERREHDPVDLAALRGIRGRLESGQRRVPARLGRFAERDGVAGDEIERHERRPPRLEAERSGRAAGDVDPRSGNALARLQHRRIGVDDDVGLRVDVRPRQKLHADLGADAVGVAQQQGEARPASQRRSKCGQSTRMFAVLMSLPKRSYSSRFIFANWSIVSLPGSPPSPLSRAWTSGNASAFVSSAWS